MRMRKRGHDLVGGNTHVHMTCIFCLVPFCLCAYVFLIQELASVILCGRKCVYITISCSMKWAAGLRTILGKSVIEVPGSSKFLFSFGTSFDFLVRECGVKGQTIDRACAYQPSKQF